MLHIYIIIYIYLPTSKILMCFCEGLHNQSKYKRQRRKAMLLIVFIEIQFEILNSCLFCSRT